MAAPSTSIPISSGRITIWGWRNAPSAATRMPPAPSGAVSSSIQPTAPGGGRGPRARGGGGGPGARLALAALGGAAAPDRADPAFVRGLYDHYAGNFDAHLVERLAYRAPEI